MITHWYDATKKLPKPEKEVLAWMGPSDEYPKGYALVAYVTEDGWRDGMTSRSLEHGTGETVTHWATYTRPKT